MPEIQMSTNAASLIVKVELVGATHTNQMKSTIVIDLKPDIITKCQLSTKPMRVSAKITGQNFHQKEPMTVFASYWNGLSKADKELYKCKAAAQLKSAGASTTSNDADEE
ncbi:uncharacterized protein EDB91DRAFT_1088673 [Suillus paluster]|uniref:uncharacterized protein n=1 Tax=Suillus paluster TaxID=48578 RepID=UPI001B87DC08|nr:uncharacterized protein EDB91DRAFT_1088673 [Suillus paluster]KAG1720858.1 hypothetical protein EDB91DRAFT_1088673 [Suillus paluster]